MTDICQFIEMKLKEISNGRNLLAKVESVDQTIFFALVQDSCGLKFDGDPPLSLNIHIVEELFRHVSSGHCFGTFQNAIGQCGFSMVNVLLTGADSIHSVKAAE